MIKCRKGQIVFINSSSGRHAKANAGHYGATKHALKGFADSLREEVNASGVRVLSLFLGRTATPMQAAIHEFEGRSYRPDALIQPEDVAFVVAASLSLARNAEITDISMRPLAKVL
jgi:NADP-dependent 3-hydroxy acid dehydrogenase YdfG